MRRQPRRNPRLAPFPMRATFAPPGPPGIITGKSVLLARQASATPTPSHTWDTCVHTCAEFSACACPTTPSLACTAQMLLPGSMGAKWLQSVALMLADKPDCIQVETMIGCRSHSWVAPQGCLGVPWEGLALEARGLLPHSFWAATEAQAELLELLAASVCPDTCYCHDRMPSKTSILMRDTLKAERLLVLQ